MCMIVCRHILECLCLQLWLKGQFAHVPVREVYLTVFQHVCRGQNRNVEQTYEPAHSKAACH